MVDVHRRLSTFSTCQLSIRFSPILLARKGFYYDALTSKVTCQGCRLTLDRLEDGNDTKILHNPGCPYRIQKEIKEPIYGNMNRYQSLSEGIENLRRTSSERGVDVKETHERTRCHSFPSCLERDGVPRHKKVSSIGFRFPVEPREIKARLDTPVVRSIVDAGTSIVAVRKVIERQLRTFGDDFSNAESLMQAIYELESDEESFPGDAGTREEIFPDSDDSVASSGSVELDLSPEWTCKICLDAEVTIVFLPCAHLATCSRCASKLNNCPICRRRILRTIRASIPKEEPNQKL